MPRRLTAQELALPVHLRPRPVDPHDAWPASLSEGERLGRSLVISAGSRSLFAFCTRHPEVDRKAVSVGWRGGRIAPVQVNKFVAALVADGVQPQQSVIERVFPLVSGDVLAAPPQVVPAGEAEWDADEEPEAS